MKRRGGSISKSPGVAGGAARGSRCLSRWENLYYFWDKGRLLARLHVAQSHSAIEDAEGVPPGNC